MRRYERSPMSSPSRKRQKTSFSSPVFPDLNEEDFRALDEIERRLSQSSYCPSQSKYASPSKHSKLSASDCSENPFYLPSPPTKPAFAFSGFTAASAIGITHEDSEYMHQSSPEPPEDKDYSSWFEATEIPETVGFQSAKAVTSASASISSFSKVSAMVDKEQLPILGFRTAGKGSGFLAPSATALAKAEQRIKMWQEEEGEPEHPQNVPARSPLRTVQHSMSKPETPCPPSRGSGFASASQLSSSFTRASGFVSASSSNKPSAFVSPVIEKMKSNLNRPKPFKSPLIDNPGVASTPTKLSQPTASSRIQHPLAAPPTNASFQTPVLPTTSSAQIPPSTSRHLKHATTPRNLTNPARHMLDSAGRIRSTPAKFITPFKKGMKPGESGRIEFEAARTLPSQARITFNNVSKEKGKGKMEGRDLRISSVFDMTSPPSRISLMESGLQPQQYGALEMIDYNIAIEELCQIRTPSLALYYSFYITPQPSDSPTIRVEDQIGPATALQKLLAHGCSRATKTWVDNAWCLILWKLAGMVALEPGREAGSPTFGSVTEGPRWCWDEVWRQLLYRYEREMNLGIRAPFHLITTQDHPATAPMVLCISNIIWPDTLSSPDGQQVNHVPLLEVTDGWYRLKAKLDSTMISALDRRKLCIGRKIAVVGCRLDTERKDPLEPLDAYESTKLILNGNSSQLAPWHTKLGFQRGPYVFAMHSLTPEGGNVALMDIVVLQVHPVAYFEFRIGPDGNKYQEGPRNDADEAACRENWRRKREAAESKLNEAHEKNVARYLSYADRLDQKASLATVSEEPPDNIDTLYDELEQSDSAGRVLSRMRGSTAVWLARYIRERLEKDQERVRDELEKEVNELCPPRVIRSFRVIGIQDSRTSKFPANRTAQLTIWDVVDLRLAEDKPRGYFEVGWRCLVTNLMPSSKKAWMGHERGSEIYLVTTRASKWQKLKTLE